MITLQKLRVYRDHAEVLLQAHLVDAVEVSPSTRVYAIPLGTLTPTERDSLHILSPHQRLLHVTWRDHEERTDHVDVGSRSPQTRGEAQGAKGAQPPLEERAHRDWSSLVELIQEQRALLHQRTKPQSLPELRRTLQLTELLDQFEDRWSKDASDERDPEAERMPEHVAESPRDDQSMTLYLYMQAAQGSDDQHTRHLELKRNAPARLNIDASSLPDALSGGWLDSSPPTLSHAVHDQPERSASSDDRESDDSESSRDLTPSVWLRLNLERSFWRPYVTLFLNGERGRLTLTAQLAAEGLQRIFRGFNTDQLRRGIPSQGIEVEWWDDHLTAHVTKAGTDLLDHQEPLVSRVTADELIAAYHPVSPQKALTASSSQEAHSRSTHSLNSVRLHLDSVLLVERSLGELSREQLVMSQHQQSNSKSILSSPDNELGYFSTADLFTYPPALVNGAEQSLAGQRVVRLLIGHAESFLRVSDQWELQLQGNSHHITPRLNRGGVISFNLGPSEQLSAHRIQGGLEVLSLQASPRRVAVYDVSKRVLLAEQQLSSLGAVKLNALGEHLEQSSRAPQPVHDGTETESARSAEATMNDISVHTSSERAPQVTGSTFEADTPAQLDTPSEDVSEETPSGTGVDNGTDISSGTETDHTAEISNAGEKLDVHLVVGRSAQTEGDSAPLQEAHHQSQPRTP